MSAASAFTFHKSNLTEVPGRRGRAPEAETVTIQAMLRTSADNRGEVQETGKLSEPELARLTTKIRAIGGKLEPKISVSVSRHGESLVVSATYRGVMEADKVDEVAEREEAVAEELFKAPTVPTRTAPKRTRPVKATAGK